MFATDGVCKANFNLKEEMLYSFILIYILTEINIIYFRGKDHIVGIDLCLRNNGSVVFVMPYMKHDKFSVSL